MQSFSDLNNYANTSLSYNTANDYVIEFSNTAANLQTIEYEGSFFNVVKEQELVVLINPSADVLITFTLSNTASVSDVVNVSAGSTISLIKIDDSEYIITGVRSTEDYAAVFSGVFLQTRSDVLTGFDITVLANDQRGNTKSWTHQVTLIENPLLSYPNALFGLEDELLSLGNIQISDTYGAETNYTLSLSAADVDKGLFDEFGNLVSTLFIEDDKDSINAVLSAPDFGFQPASDFFGETSINLSLTRTADNRSTLPINIPIFISEQPEYYLENSYVYKINTPTTLIWQVLDKDPAANSHTVSFSQISGNTGTFFVDGIEQAGNTVTFTGNVANINTNIVAIKPSGNTFGNIGLVYNQSKDVSGNVVVQADNLPLTLLAGIQDLSLSRTYNTTWYKAVFDDITINPVYGNTASSIQIGLATNLSTQGVFANTDEEARVLFDIGSPFIYQWSAQGTSAQVQTALRAARFYPKPGYTGNVTVDMLIRSPVGSVSSDAVVPLTLTPVVGGYPAPQFLTFNNSAIYTPPFPLAAYGKADILLVGGGGGSSGSIAPVGSSGGGGGRVVTAANVSLTSQSYAISVGNGGNGNGRVIGNTGFASRANGSPGGSTVAFGYTALGGTGGRCYSYLTTPPGNYLRLWFVAEGGASNFPGGYGGTLNQQFFPTTLAGGGGGAAPGGGGWGGDGTFTAYGAGGDGVAWFGTTYGAGQPGSNTAGRNGSKGVVRIRWHSGA